MKKIFMIVLIFFMFISSSFAFSDEDNFVWAKDAIKNWTSRGYVSGYPDGTFRGNNKITRAEVISIINKLNNSDIITNKRPSRDIDYNDWFYNDMGKAANLGLISVDADGNLRPNDFATREEVMVILSKLLNISYSGNFDKAKVKQFSDVNQISAENYKRVTGMVEEGFVNGYKDNTLRPKANITRAEFICVLNNAISEVVSRGNYDNKALVGNVVINGENVKLTNSEILGKIFVLDGAKNGLPNLINTKVSKGINSRVGEILIKNIDEYETLTEYNYNNPEEYNEPVFAKLVYSNSGWTNDDVEIKISFNNDEAEAIGGKRITAKKNGEYIIEYVYKGKTRSIVAKVENIDKIKPIVMATVESKGSYAVVKVEVSNDGLSPITEISCGNLVNKMNSENGTIENIFNVMKGGSYIVSTKDEAGNIGNTTVQVPEITYEVTATAEVKDAQGIITVNYIDNLENPIQEISCSNGDVNTKDETTGVLKNTFSVAKSGNYTITIKDKSGNIGKTDVVVPEIVRAIKGNIEEFAGYSIIEIVSGDNNTSPFIKISCSNGENRVADETTGLLDNKFKVSQIGTYKFAVEDKAGNLGEVTVIIDKIKPFTYGIRRPVDSLLSTWERVESAKGLEAKATHDGTDVKNDFDSIYPWSDIKTYNYDTVNNKITAWIGDETFKFDGTNGEVLTYIPEFYYDHFIDDGYEYYYIAGEEIDGYIKSEEFSIGRYKMSESNGAGHSFSGATPVTQKTINEHRDLAKALGSNFGQLDWRYFTIQMLYLVEYADYDSETVLGKGMINNGYYLGFAVNKSLISESNTTRFVIANSDDLWVGKQINIGTGQSIDSVAKSRTIEEITPYDENGVQGFSIKFSGNPVNIDVDNCLWSQAQKSGGCDALGMKSGCINNDGRHSVIYRGIEDIYKNVYEWVDGINVDVDSKAIYVCYDPEKYDSTMYDVDYEMLNYILPPSGYPTKMGLDTNHPLIVLPISTSSTDNQFTCDSFTVGQTSGQKYVMSISGIGEGHGLWFVWFSFSSNIKQDKITSRILKY